MQHIKNFFNTRNPFAQHLGIEVTDITTHSATARMELGPSHANPFGTANAGSIFSLAETAFGAAANAGGNMAVAVNLSISYLKPGISGMLTARANEVSQGGPLASYEVTVFDENDQAIAHATAMAYRRKESLPVPDGTDGS
ncbi:MAG: PaaI family thioesterase [Desulfovibrio sp.]|nr:MAG: PaaI family thioesterase [Desulfovibrio sp.]